MKKKRSIDFEKDVFDYIMGYSVEKDISFSAAVNDIIKEYMVEDRVEQKIFAPLDKTLTRLRLGTSTADKNSQVIIEILNGMCNSLNVTPMLTNVYETSSVATARIEINNRVANFKQANDWKKKHKKE